MYIPIIAGATGTGKTKISIELAKKINGEIISADSMQIYKDMNIGTAKVTYDEMQGISHHMISIISPKEKYSVSEYVDKVEELISEIIKRDKTPIIVGGTGLYINTLINGIKHGDKLDKDLREKLNKDAEDEEKYTLMYEKAKKIDPIAMEKIPYMDKKRTIRVIEIYMLTGKTKTKIEEENRIYLKNRKYKFKIFALTLPREIQYEVINKRVDKMVKDGLIEENKNIFNKYFNEEFNKIKNIKGENELEQKEEYIEKLIRKYTSLQAIGYKEILKYLLDMESEEEAIEKLKQGTRRYAKRQYTWFRKNNPFWIDVLDLHSDNENIQKDCIDRILKTICDEINKE